MTFFAAKFANIRTITTEGEIVGYQAIVLKEHSKKVTGSDDKALIEVLKLRNEMYKKMNTIHGSLLKNESNPSVNLSTETNGGNDDIVDTWCIQLRNLQTGKPSQRHYRHHKYGGKRNAKRVAKERLLNNITTYNSMIKTFNQLTINDGIKLAEQEAHDLKPHLQHMKKLEKERWALVYEQFFPNSLADPTDPSSGKNSN